MTELELAPVLFLLVAALLVFDQLVGLCEWRRRAASEGAEPHRQEKAPSDA